MLDYYNSRYDIAKIFGVSEGSVRNWIKKAINKEVHLQLVDVNGVKHILKNEHNLTIINELVEKGRKHKPLDTREVVQVDKEIYKVLDDNQLIELINLLETSKNIPHKFAYINGGADLWEKFYKRSLEDQTYQTTHSDLYFFENQYKLIKDTVNTDRKVNIIDIGGGNGEPAIPLLRQLQKDKLLNSYTAIDISQGMLDYVKKHLESNNIKTKCYFYTRDFEKDSLQDILFTTKYSSGERLPTIILGLGGVLFNNSDIIYTLKHITKGLCPEDILIITNALSSNKDTINFSSFTIPEIHELDTRISNFLQLKGESVETELLLNEKTGYREYNLILQKDIDIDFTKLKHTVRFHKYDKITIWIHKKDTFEIINKNAELLDMQLKTIIKHPTSNNVMYIMNRN
jgi:Histidine-specific methyltransferase, SAM-dependent